MTKTGELVKKLFEDKKSIQKVVELLIKMFEDGSLQRYMIQQALRANGVATRVTDLSIYFDGSTHHTNARLRVQREKDQPYTFTRIPF